MREVLETVGSVGPIQVVRPQLFFLYLATFIMRAAAYLSVAVISSARFEVAGVSAFTVGLVIAFYPLSEVLSVMFFGVICDKRGRKPVLLFAHLVTALVAFLFPSATQLLVLVLLSALFGVGAAAKVSSTLTMVADLSHSGDRAQLMAFFDMTTLGGLAFGYVAGFLLLNVFGLPPIACFNLAGVATLLSVVFIYLFVGETRHEAADLAAGALLSRTFRDKAVQRLLPVYLPIMCMYGLLIAFAQRLVESIELSLHSPGFQLLALVGTSLLASMIINAKLSDRLGKRRPFIAIGLLCFGALTATIVANLGSLASLAGYAPLLVAMGLGAGAFPPAVLAHLSDISKRESRGTMFGTYSVIFGSGMILGPLSGGYMLDHYGTLGFTALVAALTATALVGVTVLEETRRN